jgi:hypothetical protein
MVRSRASWSRLGRPLMASTPEMIIEYRTGSSTPIVYRVFSDQLGSPRYVGDSTGTIVFQASYSAFGMRTVATGAEDFMPFGFAGGCMTRIRN